MTVNTLRILRIVSERATTVATAVPVSRDLADVEVTDTLCDRSVSIQSLPQRRPGYTLPQYVQADGRVSGESLTPFCNGAGSVGV